MGQAPEGSAYNNAGEGWPLIAGPGDFGELYPQPKKHTRQATRLCRQGDIVLGIRASIGERVLSDREYCLGRGVAGLRPKRGLDHRFLWHWLGRVQPELAARAKGATFKQVSRPDIAGLPIELPSLGEQRRIANVLDRADALRGKRQAALAQLAELTQSIFLDMFGDPDPSWPSARVSDLAKQKRGSIRTGPFGSQLLHSEFQSEGVAVLGIDNAVANEFRWDQRRFITEEKYEALRKYKVYPRDLVITIMGTCGRCAILPDDIPLAITTKHLCCISLDPAKSNPEFVHAHFLNHPVARAYLERQTKGAIMSGLNMEIIKNMPISVPPLALQAQFARRLEAARSTRASGTESKECLDALFTSLQYRAFRGEL